MTADAPQLTVLDGPLGTELTARGVATPLPGWSAHALDGAPGVVAAVHRDYAASGAELHTTNTFRTRPDVFGDRWMELAERAVRIARDAVPTTHRVLGSMAPLGDCFRPDLSPMHTDPAAARREHAALAGVLVSAGCDVLLCETFPLPAEALVAVEAAVATGIETWVSFTPGPETDLLTPDEIAEAASTAANSGASSVLVNCLPASRALAYVRAIVGAVPRSVGVGVYANRGRVDAVDGWAASAGEAAEYAVHARAWIEAGATIVGGCCGTGPAEVRAVAALRDPA